MIQTLISRSDRRLAAVIVAVRGHHEQLGGWKKAYRELASQNQNHGVPLPAWQELIHGNWQPSRCLPWDHLEGPLPKSTLLKHHQEALEAAAV